MASVADLVRRAQMIRNLRNQGGQYRQWLAARNTILEQQRAAQAARQPLVAMTPQGRPVNPPAAATARLAALPVPPGGRSAVPAQPRRLFQPRPAAPVDLPTQAVGTATPGPLAQSMMADKAREEAAAVQKAVSSGPVLPETARAPEVIPATPAAAVSAVQPVVMPLPVPAPAPEPPAPTPEELQMAALVSDIIEAKQAAVPPPADVIPLPPPPAPAPEPMPVVDAALPPPPAALAPEPMPEPALPPPPAALPPAPAPEALPPPPPPAPEPAPAPAAAPPDQSAASLASAISQAKAEETAPAAPEPQPALPPAPGAQAEQPKAETAQPAAPVETKQPEPEAPKPPAPKEEPAPPAPPPPTPPPPTAPTPAPEPASLPPPPEEQPKFNTSRPTGPTEEDLLAALRSRRSA